MKHVLIVNPISGKEDSRARVIPMFESAAMGLDYVVEVTKAPGHASQITKSYAVTGEPVRFYVCGGDGTLNEAFSGCYQYENAEIASIPCGSGNDFIKNFGTIDEFLNLEDAINGVAIKIDLMQANNGISAAISSVGLDSDVAYDIPKFRRLPFCGGSMAYNLSILKRLCSKLGKNLIIETDENTYKGQFLLAAVCNGCAYGGGFYAAPTANLQDGLMDVILVKKISRFKIAGVLAKYKNGEHITNGKITKELEDILFYVKSTGVKIRSADKASFVVNIDGECSIAEELSVKMLPSCAKFVLPANVAERFNLKFTSV